MGKVREIYMEMDCEELLKENFIAVAELNGIMNMRASKIKRGGC